MVWVIKDGCYYIDRKYLVGGKVPYHGHFKVIYVRIVDEYSLCFDVWQSYITGDWVKIGEFSSLDEAREFVVSSV